MFYFIYLQRDKSKLQIVHVNTLFNIQYQKQKTVYKENTANLNLRMMGHCGQCELDE